MNKTAERERSQKQSPGPLQAIADNVADTILQSDRSGRISYVNRTMPGMTREQVLSSTVFDFVPPEQRPIIEQALAGVFDRRETSRYDSLGPGFQGEWRDYEVSVSPVLVDDRVVSAVFLARDITERKRAEKALRTQEELHRRVLETALDGFCLVDCQGNLLEANEAYCHMSGYSAAELLAMRIRDLDALESPEETASHMQRLLAEGQGRFETRHRRKDGSTFDVEISAKPLSESADHVLVFLRDITQRKRAEEQLRQSHQSHQQLLDHARDGIFSVDADAHFAFVNPAICTMLGYTREDLLGLDILDTYPDEMRESGRARLAQIRRGESVQFERAMKRRDGSFITVEASAWKTAEGHTQAIVRDITERRRTQEALRISEQKFSKIFHNSSNAIAITEFETGKIVDVNETWVKASGITRVEAVGRKAYELGIWADPANRSFCIAELKKSGRVRDFEASLFMASKNLTHLLSADVIEIENQQVVLWEFRNIDERKKTESALRESETRLRLIAETITEVFWLVDYETGRMLYVSPAYERIWGRPRASLLADPHSFFAAIHPEDRERAIAGLAVKDQGEPFDLEYRIVRPDGEIRWIWDRGFPVREDTGQVTKYIGIAQDVTGRKREESEKARLEAQLRQAQKMESVGRLAGGVAHDFNNMLGVILGYAEIAAAKTDPSDSLHADLTEIHKAAAHSAELTRQLLAFARRQTVAPVRLDLNEKVAGALKLLRRLMGEMVDLVWIPGEELWPVRVDPSQIDMILTNLCVNARDALAENGKVTIQTGKIAVDQGNRAAHRGCDPGEYVLLTVSDNGCGMDEETMLQIFEPFFTTKGVGTGTGLGLSMVYGIVKQNKGFIDVCSEPTRGTTFRIYLPKHTEKNGEHPRAESALVPSVRGHETILLVEDEPAILRMTAMMLTGMGYNVLSASAPGEAIRIAREHGGDIHLLLTDVVMPEMNGRDLAKNLLSLYPRMKRLFTSGYTADVIAHHGVLDEGVQFIQKPFSIEDLAVKLREVLDKP
jgi:two-component system cell cycle sensor histidine kinase/response regulator CckA